MRRLACFLSSFFVAMSLDFVALNLAMVFADGLVQPDVHILAPVYAFVALKARSFGLFSIDM